jgi:hypothetical protein
MGINSAVFGQSNYLVILSKIGIIWSNDGLFPGSSFIQIRINLAICAEIPGEISMRSPSVAICKEFFLN